MEKINFNCIKCSNIINNQKFSKNYSFSCERCGLLYEYDSKTDKIQIDLKAITEYIKENIECDYLDGCENWGIDG